MSLDFTLFKYKELCQAILTCGYRILRFDTYLNSKTRAKKFVILRHDVDIAPLKALRMAQLENELSIASTYYFRYPQTFSPHIIKSIYDLGHEIGYHYEALARAHGNYRRAFEDIRRALSSFRERVPIKTISAHGSLLSRWDNKKLWNEVDFKNFGITGDTYFSTNYDDILYVTDTGRGWNKDIANVRDKVNTIFKCPFRTTDDFIKTIREETLPRKIMINVHPPRWNNNLFDWGTELIGQNIKNVIKGIILTKRTNVVAGFLKQIMVISILRP